MRTYIQAMCLAAAACSLQAAPVKWYLSQVTFSDGGRAVGSFVYDANAVSGSKFTQINIQTTPASSTPAGSSSIGGGNYTVLNGSDTAGLPVAFTNGAGSSSTRLLQLLSSNTTLANAGTTINVATGSVEGFCRANGDCTGFLASTPTRSIISGTLVSTSSFGLTYFVSGTFDDGGQLLGSFNYDTGTNTFSNVNLNTTGGTTLGNPAQYTNVVSVPSMAGMTGFTTAPGPLGTGTRILLLPTTISSQVNAFTAGQVLEGACINTACLLGTSRALLAANNTLSSTAPSNFTRVISQIADGGGWQTDLVITNLTDSAATYSLRFYKDDGTPFAPGGLSASQSATLPARGVAFLTTTPGATLTQGSAILEGGNNFSVTAIFTSKNANAGGDQQGSVVGDAPGSGSFSVPFDNTNGSVVGLAITNTSQSPVTVLAVAYDQQGRILMTDSSLTLPAMGHTAFNFSQRAGFSTLANQKGLLRIFAVNGGAAPYVGLNGLLLKFSPNNSFTAVGVTNQ